MYICRYVWPADSLRSGKRKRANWWHYKCHWRRLRKLPTTIRICMYASVTKLYLWHTCDTCVHTFKCDTNGTCYTRVTLAYKHMSVTQVALVTHVSHLYVCMQVSHAYVCMQVSHLYVCMQVSHESKVALVSQVPLHSARGIDVVVPDFIFHVSYVWNRYHFRLR